MARKYLNRAKKDSKENTISAEDEWAHITTANGKETNIEIKDVLDVQDRSITFGDEEQEKTGWEVVKEKTKATATTANDTSKYIKYVNTHLDDQTSQINKIKQLQKRFDDDIEKLQQPATPSKKLERNKNVICAKEPAEIVKNDLVPLLEKHGIEKMVAAINQFMKSIEEIQKTSN